MADAPNLSNAARIAAIPRERIKRRSLLGDALRRMTSNPLTVVGMVIVILIVLLAVGAPIIAPYGPNQGDLKTLYLKSPSMAHPFGTDDIGRDILSRVIYGSQISVKIALFAEAFGLIVGTVIGLIAGYYGGWLDTIIMRIVDVLMAFPLLIIAIALVGVLGSSESNIIIALGLTIWPFVTRLVRSQVLSLKEAEYVAAARIVGASDRDIMFRHMLPNMLTPLVVYGTLGLAGIILQEASLSFLGLGTADASTPSWGKMLNDSQAFLRTAWWFPLFPGLAILITVLGFNLLGDGLRDALDVRSR